MDNDVELDFQSLQATLVSGPLNGQLNLSTDGLFDYTPNAGFTGIDFFIYKAVDPDSLESQSATVTLSIATFPIVLDDSFCCGWKIVY